MTLMTLFTFLAFLFVSGFTVGYHTTCDDGWTAYEGYCYWFADKPRDFTEAGHYCEQEHNSHLIEVYSTIENSFVRDQLRKRADKGRCHWLGLTDETNEGVWQWHTGNNDIANFTDWHPGQPGKDGEEDCVVFWADYDYQWGDYGCMNICFPVCKRGGYHDETEIIG